MADDGGSQEHLITYYMWTIVSPILITIGTVGNSLAVVVLTRKSVRWSSASVYLIALAVADTLALLTGLLRQFILSVARIDVRHLSNVGCKIHTWIVYVSLDTSVWILVAFTFERILSVFTPHKVKSYCTRKSSALIVIGILVTLMAVNGHLLYGFGLITKKENQTSVGSFCDYVSQDYDYIFNYVWPWIDLSIYSLIPFTIFIVGNSCISARLLLRRRKLRRVAAMEVTPDTNAIRVATIQLSQGRVSAAASRNDKNASTTVLLLLLNLVFLITTAPVSVYLIVEPSWSKRITTSKHVALSELVYTIVNLIMYVNASSNFILYCVTGSRFRKELMNIFRKQRMLILTETIKVD